MAKIKKVSKKLYLGGYIASQIFGLPLVVTGFLVVMSALSAGSVRLPEDRLLFCMLLVAVGTIVSLIGPVLFFVLVYKGWQVIQRFGYARTTPAKAAWLLLVPIFNIYWTFQVFWGFARDYNTTISKLDIDAEPLSEGLFLAICVLPLCGLVPGIGTLANITCVIITVICIPKLCNAINTIIDIENADLQADNGVFS